MVRSLLPRFVVSRLSVAYIHVNDRIYQWRHTKLITTAKRLRSVIERRCECMHPYACVDNQHVCSHACVLDCVYVFFLTSFCTQRMAANAHTNRAKWTAKRSYLPFADRTVRGHHLWPNPLPKETATRRGYYQGSLSRKESPASLFLFDAFTAPSSLACFLRSSISWT